MEVNLDRAVEVEIPIKQGNTFFMQLRFWSDKKKTDPTLLTGSFILTLERSASCCAPCTSIDALNKQVLIIGNGLTISDTNCLTINQLLTLGPGNFTIDLTQTDGNGVVTTWLSGTVIVIPRP